MLKTHLRDLADLFFAQLRLRMLLLEIEAGRFTYINLIAMIQILICCSRLQSIYLLNIKYQQRLENQTY